MSNIEQKDKIAVGIIAGLFVFSFFVNLLPYYVDNEQGDKIDRIILFSFDSCNPEYLSEDYMPRLYTLLKEQGVIYKNAWCPIAAETMNGHTTMLTGCVPNRTGIIGNSFYCDDLDEDEQPENPVQDPDWRLVDTVFEYLEDNHKSESKKTGFLSGKWRLPDFLAHGAEYVFASPVCKEFDICPPGYEAKVGQPVTYIDGDITDSWIMRALTELVYNDDPEFIFVNLAEIDYVGHDTGSFNLNMKRHMLEVDNMIWNFINDLKAMGKYESTLMIFTGDHGMDTVYDVFKPAEYLEDKGIEVEHVHGEGHSAFIFLKDKDDTNKTVKELEKSDKVALVLPRNEMYKLSLDTYENRTGQVYISCKEDTQIAYGDFTMAAIGSHGGVSCRDVPLAFIGPKIRKGGFIQDTIPGLEDLVPTILDLWDLTIPIYVQGRVLNEVYE